MSTTPIILVHIRLYGNIGHISELVSAYGRFQGNFFLNE